MTFEKPLLKAYLSVSVYNFVVRCGAYAYGTHDNPYKRITILKAPSFATPPAVPVAVTVAPVSQRS